MHNSIKKILFLGPSGSYTQIAAQTFRQKLNINIPVESLSTITNVIKTLDLSDNSIAVLPIENSIEGIVRETVDGLIATKNELLIQAELTMQIQHCLISKGEKEEIRNIVSMPQALGQCQNYIADNFKKGINIVTASSTSAATSMLDGKDESWASIGNEYCARLYGKKIIEKGINDVKDNRTRFLLISKIPLDIAPPIRTSLAFSTKNETGSLLKVLDVFYKHDLNLIYIESRPSKKVFGEYTFFVDVDASVEKMQSAIDEVKQKCDFYRLLGSYCVLN